MTKTLLILGHFNIDIIEKYDFSAFVSLFHYHDQNHYLHFISFGLYPPFFHDLLDPQNMSKCHYMDLSK